MNEFVLLTLNVRLKPKSFLRLIKIKSILILHMTRSNIAELTKKVLFIVYIIMTCLTKFTYNM